MSCRSAHLWATCARTVGTQLRVASGFALLGLLPACGASSGNGSEAPAAYQWQLPDGFPAPFVPEDNPMSEAKVELGRRLFYDERLSVNGTQSCGTCHSQDRAFTDGKTTPQGATGQQLARNAMSLTNVAYLYPYTWANPLLHTLEQQALVPMFGDSPIQLGLSSVIDDVLASFQRDELYLQL